MEADQVISPFGSEPLAEVPLPRAPLVRVLSQVRWPQVTTIKANLKEVAQRLGIELADQYPLNVEKQEMHVVLGPEGASRQLAGTIYQLKSADEVWQISFADSFIALEVSQYTSREDFCARLRVVLDGLTKVASIPFATRIGFRYTNRVSGEDLADLGDLVREPVLGGDVVPRNGQAEMIHTVTESVYQVGDVRLLARWARLPPNGLVDPNIVPVDDPSWVLDLDSFQEGRLDFESMALVERARELSAVAYRFFRWATKDNFLRRFGGAV